MVELIYIGYSNIRSIEVFVIAYTKLLTIPV